MESNHRIQNAINEGYNFSIGQYISRGWDIVKQNLGGYIGYTLIFFIIIMVINFIPLLGFIIGVIVTPSLSVGFALAAHKQEVQSDVEFGNFFKGFDSIGQLVVSYIIMLAIYLILALPLIFNLGISLFSAMASSDPEAIMEASEQMTGMGVWIFITLLLYLYVGISLRWTYSLVVFHKYDAVSAIKTSWQLVQKKWFSHFLFLLLAGLIAIAGVLALFIGIFVAYPLVMVADYVGYADVTGLNVGTDEIDEIGTEEGMV